MNDDLTFQQALSLMRSAEDDCQRAITAAEKARYDLKCLQESVVDKKAYTQVKAERDICRDALQAIANIDADWSAVFIARGALADMQK